MDIPSAKDRADIFAAIIRRYKRDPKKYDIPVLVRHSEDFTGAEIEQVFIEAMVVAYGRKQEPTEADIVTAAKEIVPLARTMGEKLGALRDWAKERARYASSQEDNQAMGAGTNLDDADQGKDAGGYL